MLKGLKVFGIDMLGLVIGSLGSAAVIWAPYWWLSKSYSFLPGAGFLDVFSVVFILGVLVYSFFKVKEVAEY